MIIKSIQGDIVDLAPKVSEAMVLWLRDGFNGRFAAWEFRIRREYPTLSSLTSSGGIDRPWASPSDSVWKLSEPFQHLQYIYVIANPENATGCKDLQAVRDAVFRSLDALAEMGVQRLSMLHIPSVGPDGLPTEDTDRASARAMVEALDEWHRQHPQQHMEVILIDKANGFAAFAPLLSPKNSVPGSPK